MNVYRVFVVLLCGSVLGCNSDRAQGPVKSPRPVSVLALTVSDPGRFDHVSGTVTSWKTDQLGFEVAGRVEFVIEPEQDISGQLYDQGDQMLTEADQLARLDPTRYDLAVAAAKAEIVTAEKQREAAQIELDSVIPAQVDAADAQRDLAQTEVERNEKLVADKAAPVRALDLAKSQRDTSLAKLAELAALKEAKRAEISSMDAKIGELNESLLQAKRDLADCQLFSSFPGQIAQVHVIPGSFVERGEPVVTVQMMHPIKVEFEVAADTARRMNHRDQIRVHVPLSDGTTRQRLAFIYMIDPVADSQTRTFTVTLMLTNEKSRAEVPAEMNATEVARTDSIRKLIKGFAGQGDKLFVNENSLHSEGDEYFLWKILNRRVGTLAGQSDRVLQVAKIGVTPGELRVSVMGLATFVDLTIEEGQEFDPDRDMVTGRVIPPAGQERWNGKEVLYEVERWMLRPGDLVGVDLGGDQTQPGVYVPLDAIMERSGAYYVFEVDESPDGDSARRVEVTVHETSGTLRRIEAVEGTLAEGAKIVAGGAAFLVDGESVNVAKEVEARR